MTGQPCLGLNVAVATKLVYITQSVVGDSGGGNARYTLTEDPACGIPDDLPDNLLGTGGVTTMPSVTVVELREGYFNISTAVLHGRVITDSAGRFTAPRLALNYEADPCIVHTKVTHLPDSCSATTAEQSNDLTDPDDLDASGGRAIIGFDVTCSDDMGDDDAMDDSADDMDDGDDMDDSDAMDDSADAMGPPEDIATG